MLYLLLMVTLLGVASSQFPLPGKMSHSSYSSLCGYVIIKFIYKHCNLKVEAHSGSAFLAIV